MSPGRFLTEVTIMTILQMKKVSSQRLLEVIQWSSEVINDKVRIYREMCPKKWLPDKVNTSISCFTILLRESIDTIAQPDKGHRTELNLL